MTGHNNTTALPGSRYHGNAWRAFDQLGPETRRALREAVEDYCPIATLQQIDEKVKAGFARKVLDAAMARHIISCDAQAIAAFGRQNYPNSLSPHMAAQATIQPYDARRALAAQGGGCRLRFRVAKRRR